MNEILHLIKHLLGPCGEPHPSMLVGGSILITTIGLYWNRIMNYVKNLF